MLAVLPEDAFVVSITVPVAAPEVVGSKATLSVADCPGFSVSGNMIPDMLNSVPVTDPALTVSAAAPDEVTVTAWVAVVLRLTEPKATLAELSVSAGAAALSLSAKLLEACPAVAVRVAVWVVLTAEALAVNPALLAPGATLTDGGTATAGLLLDSCTFSPFAGAGPLRETVQGSVVAPLRDALLQVTELTLVAPGFAATASGGIQSSRQAVRSGIRNRRAAVVEARARNGSPLRREAEESAPQIAYSLTPGGVTAIEIILAS